jgi:hypothetical protein
MTKAELTAAQFLHSIADNASDRAFDLCPNWPDKPGGYGSTDHVAHAIVSLGQQARDLFWELTGKDPRDVHLTELSTLNPAEWTKTARPRTK